MEHWFYGDGAPSAELEADAKAYGIILPEPELENFDVWPENHDALQMFLDCQTQWRTTGSGVIGLDYGVVLALASMNGATDPLALLRDLQVMEMRARDLINEHAKQESES